MNLAELQTFLSIVETGSLRRTSEVLNVTQSTVTARLQALENKLGKRLINRARSGASLTAAGERLRRYAETITDLWAQARREIALPGGLSGVCNFACEADLWPCLGEHVFRRIERLQPDLALSVWLGSTAEVSAWLNDGKSDLALSSHAPRALREGGFALRPDRLILVSTDEKAPLRFDPGYVFVEAGEDFGREHAKAYADANTAKLSFGNATLGLAHLLSQGGSAYLPLRMVREHLANKRLFHLPRAPEFQKPLFMVYNQSEHQFWPWFDAAMAELQG